MDGPLVEALLAQAVNQSKSQDDIVMVDVREVKGNLSQLIPPAQNASDIFVGLYEALFTDSQHSPVDFFLPQTVVYSYGRPVAWYKCTRLDSGAGKFIIQKKRPSALKNTLILHSFLSEGAVIQSRDPRLALPPVHILEAEKLRREKRATMRASRYPPRPTKLDISTSAGDNTNAVDADQCSRQSPEATAGDSTALLGGNANSVASPGGRPVSPIQRSPHGVRAASSAGGTKMQSQAKEKSSLANERRSITPGPKVPSTSTSAQRPATIKPLDMIRKIDLMRSDALLPDTASKSVKMLHEKIKGQRELSQDHRHRATESKNNSTGEGTPGRSGVGTAATCSESILNESPFVAIFVSPAGVQYLNAQQLRPFVLLNQVEKTDGILQQFVGTATAPRTWDAKPYDLVRVAWSPKVCYIERRRNTNPLANAHRNTTALGEGAGSSSSQQRPSTSPSPSSQHNNPTYETPAAEADYAYYRRVETFDGSDHTQSEEWPVTSTEILNQIKFQSDALAKHFNKVSGGCLCIASMALNIRVSLRASLIFMWADNVRVVRLRVIPPPLPAVKRTVTDESAKNEECEDDEPSSLVAAMSFVSQSNFGSFRLPESPAQNQGGPLQLAPVRGAKLLRQSQAVSFVQMYPAVGNLIQKALQAEAQQDATAAGSATAAPTLLPTFGSAQNQYSNLFLQQGWKIELAPSHQPPPLNSNNAQNQSSPSSPLQPLGSFRSSSFNSNSMVVAAQGGSITGNASVQSNTVSNVETPTLEARHKQHEKLRKTQCAACRVCGRSNILKSDFSSINYESLLCSGNVFAPKPDRPTEKNTSSWEVVQMDRYANYGVPFGRSGGGDAASSGNTVSAGQRSTSALTMNLPKDAAIFGENRDRFGNDVTKTSQATAVTGKKIHYKRHPKTWSPLLDQAFSAAEAKVRLQHQIVERRKIYDEILMHRILNESSDPNSSNSLSNNNGVEEVGGNMPMAMTTGGGLLPASALKRTSDFFNQQQESKGVSFGVQGGQQHSGSATELFTSNASSPAHHQQRSGSPSNDRDHHHHVVPLFHKDLFLQPCPKAYDDDDDDDDKGDSVRGKPPTKAVPLVTATDTSRTDHGPSNNHVPRVFQKLHPYMTNKDFNIYKNRTDFLACTVSLCTDCIMKYMAPLSQPQSAVATDGMFFGLRSTPAEQRRTEKRLQEFQRRIQKQKEQTHHLQLQTIQQKGKDFGDTLVSWSSTVGNQQQRQQLGMGIVPGLVVNDPPFKTMLGMPQVSHEEPGTIIQPHQETLQEDTRESRHQHAAGKEDSNALPSPSGLSGSRRRSDQQQQQLPPRSELFDHFKEQQEKDFLDLLTVSRDAIVPKDLHTAEDPDDDVDAGKHVEQSHVGVSTQRAVSTPAANLELQRKRELQRLREHHQRRTAQMSSKSHHQTQGKGTVAADSQNSNHSTNTFGIVSPASTSHQRQMEVCQRLCMTTPMLSRPSSSSLVNSIQSQVRLLAQSEKAKQFIAQTNSSSTVMRNGSNLTSTNPTPTSPSSYRPGSGSVEGSPQGSALKKKKSQPKFSATQKPPLLRCPAAAADRSSHALVRFVESPSTSPNATSHPAEGIHSTSPSPPGSPLPSSPSSVRTSVSKADTLALRNILGIGKANQKIVLS